MIAPLHLQVGLMLAQRRYGRNFMVPRRFQPPKFDYHRPIPPELSAQVRNVHMHLPPGTVQVYVLAKYVTFLLTP